ncbi:MAG: hypothetical protein ABIJ12_14495 [bacterium]
MINKFRSLQNKYAKGKTVIYLLIITLAVYGFMLFYTIPSVMEFSNGMKLFDMQPLGYDADYARLLLDTLGEQGRSQYLYHQIPVDMVYPLLFAVSFSLLIVYVFEKSSIDKNWIYWISLVPLLAGLFDYIENIGIIVMLTSFPDFSTEWANMTCLFTVSKSMLTTLFWVLLLVGLVMIVKRKFRRT